MKNNFLLLLCTLFILALQPAKAQFSPSDTYRGEGTFYGYGGGGNCSFPKPGFLTAALNKSQYDASGACGACLEVTNPNNGKSVLVRIDDQCPECKPGDVDLEEAAFEQIANKTEGRIAITWNYVPCRVRNRMQIFFKEGSSPYWTALQIRQHRNPITSVAYRAAGRGSFKTIQRQPYNFFLESSGMGPGPYDIKITDVFGQEIIATNIPLKVEQTVNVPQQFPVYNGGSSSQQPLLEDGLYNIRAKNSGKSLTVAGASTQESANLHQWAYRRMSHQQWQVKHLGNQEYSIMAKHNDKAVSIKNASSIENSNAILQDFASQAAQKWAFEEAGNGFFYIKNINSGLYLKVRSLERKNGVNILQGTLAPADNYRWKPVLLGGSTSLRNSSEAITESDLLQVGPNPFQHSFQIRWTGVNSLQKVQLYDVFGTMIKEVKDIESPSAAKDFQLEATVPSGIYFLQAKTSSGQVIRKKLLKQ